MGSRLKRLGANIERKLSRHYIGRVFATGASLITQLPVYDSQCGAKFFRTDIVETLFGKKFITKWVFDVEILIRARNHFGKYEIYNQNKKYHKKLNLTFLIKEGYLKESYH